MKPQKADSTKERSITIEHKVMGSLTTTPGDIVLSFTNGVSDIADKACMLANGEESTSHASFWMVNEPKVTTTRFIHVQGQHTRFGEVRAYTTRAVYEVSHNDVAAAGGYAPVSCVLDRMKPYVEPEPGASAERIVSSTFPASILPDADQLHTLLSAVISTNSRLFIRLGADDMLRADDMRHSPKLLTLLRAIDQLPQEESSMVSVAYGVESTSPFTKALLPAFQVVAHFDDIHLWKGASAALQFDWTKRSLEIATSSSTLKTLQTTPLARTAAPTESHHDDEPSNHASPPRQRSRWAVVLILLALLALATLMGWIIY